jgi:hypothetical protein
MNRRLRRVDRQSRADGSGLLLRLEELQPVAERVGSVEPVMAGELPVPGHLDVGALVPPQAPGGSR